MTEEERREMTRNNYYALMRASHCDGDGNPDPDFVYVVRCQDCIHRDPEDKKCDCGGMMVQGLFFPRPDDWYCPLGERREEK